MTNHRDSDVLGKYTPAAPVQGEEMHGPAKILAQTELVLAAVNNHVAIMAEKRAAYQRIDELEKEREAFLAQIDPPICRLQFPDGSVPANAREAAEGWHRWYNDISKLNDARRKLIDAARIEGPLEPFPAESGV